MTTNMGKKHIGDDVVKKTRLKSQFRGREFGWVHKLIIACQDTIDSEWVKTMALVLVVLFLGPNVTMFNLEYLA